jgi:HAD superfamily hydrolase (TIGR01509 family)
MMGRRAEEAFPMMIAALGLTESAQELRDEEREIFFNLLWTHVAPMPGLLELLAHIEALGLPKAVATSSRRLYIEQILHRFELAGRFALTLTAEDVARGKPHPEIYLAAAARIGVAPGEMLVLEDSEMGTRAAAAAGALAVAVPHEHSRHHDFGLAHLVAESLADPKIRRLLVTDDPVPLSGR